MVNERAARVRRGGQHHAAMNVKPLAAPAAAALARRGLTTPPANAAAARVPPPLRGGRRTATAWRRATHRAGAAGAADAASSAGATLRGATCGGLDRSGADTNGKHTAVSAGTGAAAAAGACAAAASTQSGWCPRAAVTGIGRRLDRRRTASLRRSCALHGAVEARAGGGAPLALGEGESGGAGKRGVAGCGVGRLEKGGGRGGLPRVAVVIRAFHPLGPDGRISRAPLAGAQAGERAAVPCNVATEQVAGGGEPPRRLPRRPPLLPVAIRAASASRGVGGCRRRRGRPQAIGRVATPPPGVAGGAAAADVCDRVKGVGVAANQQGRDALCL